VIAVKVSVVLPSINNENTIGRVLTEVLRQGPDEVIVVDSSTDRTPEIVGEFKNVRLIHEDRPGPAVARNAGWRAAKGDVIVFLDADCIPGKGWLDEMLVHLDKYDIVQGVYSREGGNLAAHWTNFILQHKWSRLKPIGNGLRELTWLMTLSTAMRRSVLEKLGGFDISFTGCSGEDANFGHRAVAAGYKMVLNENADVRHYHDFSTYISLRKQFNHAKTRWQVARKGKTTDGNVTKMTYAETGLHGLLIPAAALVLIGQPLYFIALLAACLILDLRIGMWTVRETHKMSDIFITIFYFLTVLSWATGAVYGMKNIRRRSA